MQMAAGGEMSIGDRVISGERRNEIEVGGTNEIAIVNEIETEDFETTGVGQDQEVRHTIDTFINVIKPLWKRIVVRRRKASKYRGINILLFSICTQLITTLFRISPPTRPSTPPRSSQSVSSPQIQRSTPESSKEKEQVVDMELDLPPSPPPVEDILAVRRAKRLAILAKYSSADDGTPSQSPSSAVQPPLPSSSLSDPVTLAPSPSTTSPSVTVNGHGTAVSVTEASIDQGGVHGATGKRLS
jgi:hypothetical protein